MSDSDTRITHQKPAAFYREFFRKGPGQQTTHYCPGCGHGTAHKLIAEAISDFGIQDRVVFCSPVGCSVFAYYYFDCGNIQCAHGRAPAVATGIRRTLPGAIIIAYQGDGDLAGIGAGAIIHAANRGENITVFFINNAIYGMTGGQMAPTTLIGQKTMTTPLGRSAEHEGYPIGMSEIMSAIKAPVFIERVSFGDVPGILKARRAIRKALDNQIHNKGFSYVEILSPCPVNWKLSPTASRQWLKENMEPVFPVKNFRDESASREPAKPVASPECSDEQYLKLFGIDLKESNEPPTTPPAVKDQHVKIAGFGGQGVMSAGVLLANCAVATGLNATWLPSYGPEMRGGTAYASVIISNSCIGAPVVDNPNVLLALNAPSLDAFEDMVQKGGLILVNSSLISRQVKRQDVQAVYVPASDIAGKAGLLATANVVMLTLYIALTGIFDMQTVRAKIPLFLKKKSLADINLNAVEASLAFYRNNYGQQKKT